MEQIFWLFKGLMQIDDKKDLPIVKKRNEYEHTIFRRVKVNGSN